MRSIAPRTARPRPFGSVSVTAPSSPNRCSDATTSAPRAVDAQRVVLDPLATARRRGCGGGSPRWPGGRCGPTARSARTWRRAARRGAAGGRRPHPSAPGCGRRPSMTSRWNSSSTSCSTEPRSAARDGDLVAGLLDRHGHRARTARSRRAGRPSTPAAGWATPARAAPAAPAPERSPSYSVRCSARRCDAQAECPRERDVAGDGVDRRRAVGGDAGGAIAQPVLGRVGGERQRGGSPRRDSRRCRPAASASAGEPPRRLPRAGRPQIAAGRGDDDVRARCRARRGTGGGRGRRRCRW